MHVHLYRTTDTTNKINKKLTNDTTFEGVIFRDVNNLDIVNPSVLLNISDEVSDIAKFNYAYIPKFNRYYFITKVSTENALVRIDMHTDVLKSFSKDILASTQYVTRSDKLHANNYLVDNLLPMNSKSHYTVHTFGDEVDDDKCYHVILETTGKGGTT